MQRLVALLLLAALSTATEYQDCGSHATGVLLDVEGCDIPPCVVERGSSFLVNITFDADHDLPTINATVTANIGGIETPWPGFDTNACAYLIVNSCPIAGSTTSVWQYPVEVLPEYPTISTVATFRITAEDHDEVCLQCPVTII